MKYILDASVALKCVLTEVDSSKALLIRDDFRNQVVELISPDVYPIEAAHALTRAERKGIIKLGQAIVLLTNILSTPVPLRTYMSLLPRAAAISSAMRCGVYDCLYIALAERENCELLTADEKMVKRLRSTFPIVVPLSSLP